MRNRPEGIRLPAQWFLQQSYYVLFACFFPILWLATVVATVTENTILSLFAVIILVFVLVFGFTLGSGTTAYLSASCGTVCLLGIPVKRIDLTKLKLVCTVSNGNGATLCLSQYSETQLAAMRVEQMRKGVFTRHELPLRQGKPGWESRFAAEYLNKLIWRPFKGAFSQGFLWLNMDTAALVQVRNLFPQTAYRNYLKKQFDYEKADKVAPLYLNMRTQRSQLLPEGVHVHEKGKTVWFLPAAQVQTVLRVDRFVPYSKVDKECSSRLVVCSLRKEALIRLATGGQNAEAPDTIADVAILSYCLHRIQRWNASDRQMCPLHCCDQTEAALREYYPDAQWIDLSDYWKTDYDPIENPSAR